MRLEIYPDEMDIVAETPQDEVFLHEVFKLKKPGDSVLARVPNDLKKTLVPTRIVIEGSYSDFPKCYLEPTVEPGAVPVEPTLPKGMSYQPRKGRGKGHV